MVGLALILFLSIISATCGHYFVHWIGDGEQCNTSYGEVFNCVHPDSCYPKYYKKPENQAIICGLKNWVTLMCCIIVDNEDWLNSQNLYHNSGHLPINHNHDCPCSNPTQNPNNTDSKQSNNTNLQQSPTNNILNQKDQQTEENDEGQSNSSNQSELGEMVAQNATINFPSNTDSKQSNNANLQQFPVTNSLMQEGQQIEGDIGQINSRSQSELAQMVAQNVTINFPFYPPSSENSTSLKNCRSFYEVRRLYCEDCEVFVGRNARPGEYKHMAALGYGDEKNTEWLCGGSLISVNFVLTAAHCRTSRRYGPVKFVRLGALNIRNPTNEISAETYGIDTVISYPLYVRWEGYHDIALIKLNETVFLTTFIRPACLATMWDLKDITLNVTGWGLTETLESANILQTAALQYVTRQRCQSIYEDSKGLKAGIIETLQICADGVSKGSDTCQGDSGGPLQFTNTFYDFGTFPEIAGITSNGIGCGLTVGVYTRVLPYVPWIEGIVWPNE